MTRITASLLIGLGLLLAKAAQAAEPNCSGFGGMIHGQSTCRSLDFATGKVTESASRVMSGPGVVSLTCEQKHSFGKHEVQVVCSSKPAGEYTRTIEISLVVDGKPSVLLDKHTGFWDFIKLWAKATEAGIQLTIDYGVLD